MRLLLYGGTFDPPHNGHLNNLRAAAARVRPDRVVVMPAGLSPFKQSTAAPGSARVEMCACFRALEAEGAVPALCVSGWEVEQAALGRRNYTVLTLEMLARTYPEAELYMAMGSDMLLSFDSWHRWQEILRLARLVVTSRNVGDAPELHAKAKQMDPTGARILFAQVEALPMASSNLRARLAAGEACENELPALVRRVIRREGLYRADRGESGKTMNLKQAKELVRGRLSDKRYEHTLNVRKMAVKLAKRYGVDEDKAALAALLHDSAKEISKDEMRAIMRAHPELAEGGEERPTPVWHGICAAILARTEWGVEDEAVLSAIACHTAGKPGMSRLDKIVYLADMSSKERDWPGVNKLRKLELKDLDLAMLAALRQTNDFVLSQDKPLDPMSKAAYDEIKAGVDARAAKAG